MNIQDAKSPMILLCAALALLLPPAQADTVRTAEAYQTEFDDAVAADFCGGAVMELRYNPTPGGDAYTTRATNSFHNGYARLSSIYANHVMLALVAGGAQSPTLVSVGNVPGNRRAGALRHPARRSANHDAGRRPLRVRVNLVASPPEFRIQKSGVRLAHRHCGKFWCY